MSSDPGEIDQPTDVEWERRDLGRKGRFTPLREMTLREFRLSRDLTVAEVALLAGCDKSTVSRVEGGLQPVSPKMIVRLAKALGVSAETLSKMCLALPADPGTDTPRRPASRQSPVGVQSAGHKIAPGAEHPLNAIISAELRAARALRRLGQRDVAQRMREQGFNWTQQTVSLVERSRKAITAAELGTLADIYGFAVDGFFRYRGLRPQENRPSR